MRKHFLSFLKRSYNEVQACEKLEKKLSALAKPVLSADASEQLKKNILQTIARQSQTDLLPSSLQKLGTQVTRVGQKTLVPEYVKLSMKERILGYIEDRLFYGFNGGFFARSGSLKGLVSYVVLMFFAVSSLFLFPFQAHVAQARSTYVSELYGDVFVLRNREMIKGKVFLDLREGDVILTKNKSFVAIHFFDDSLSRLGENTEVEIQKLYEEPFNPVVTQVGLFLKQGRVWTRVINLIDDKSAFTVDAGETQAKVAKKAAFDVSVKNDEVKVAVFDNVVDVVSADSNGKNPQSVVAGFEAAVSSDNPVQLLAFDDVISTNKPYAPWVESNLNRDQAYDEQVIEEKEKLINSDHQDQSFDVLESTLGKDAVLLADGEVQKAAEDFLAAYRELKRGETMLVRGLHAEGIQSLKNFQLQARAVINKLPELELKDSFSTGLLRQMIEDKISLQLKDLATFLPGERLYVAKEVLQQVEQLLQTDDVGKTQVRLSQAEGKLLEIQELIKDEKVSLAITMLKGYERQTAEFVLKVTDENIGELEDKLVDIVNQQVQQIKALTAIEHNLKTTVSDDQKTLELLESVQKVRRESMKQLVVGLDQLPEVLSAELVTDLKNVFDTYLAASHEDDDLIIPVFNKLLSKDYQLSFIQPDEGTMPEKLGAVTIVTGEASGDVTTEIEESIAIGDELLGAF